MQDAAVPGIAGSAIDSRLTMAEFRDTMDQQMARSASVLCVAAGGGASRGDIAQAVCAEYAYQELLAHKRILLQKEIDLIRIKTASLIEHLKHQEHLMKSKARVIKRFIVAALQTSAKSDVELAKVLRA